MIFKIRSQTQASVRQICRALELSRSSFYPCRRGRRLAQELRDHGVTCAHARLRRLMRQRGLRAIQPKHYLPRTSDSWADQPSANLLARQPLPTQPNQAWTGV